MATERDRPYSAFRYLVDLGGGTDGAKAGFQEVTGLGVEITMQEYRAGNERLNAPIKIPGLYKATDISLKRGVLGALDLTEWLNQVRRGENARRNITIELQGEDGQTAMTWKLKNAQPMKYTGPSLNGKGTDVAIEELGLAVEDIEFE
ncbi:MAG: phage tail protein [Leptolyngbya sp.]|nr:MAG: phage tail protein [Leptolyngbya sp.]